MNGQCFVRGAALRGVEAVPVRIEVSVSRGMPGFALVGMADAAVQESRERVKAAIRACGFAMPNEKIVVNLAPSWLKKTGSGFDAAIAVGILAATGQIPAEAVREALFVGELSLDGRIRPIAGMLAYALCARREGVSLVCSKDVEGVIAIEGVQQLGVSSLRDVGKGEFDVLVPQKDPARPHALDFSDIAGNGYAKRALQIAAAGSHGVLMMGPPGSGKTMLASRMPTILPPLSEDEKLQAALVHSVAGLDIGEILSGVRPFRAPHHSSSSAGLIGGGRPLRPGEISLAHEGVLFLDEVSEFRPSALQQLRQPLEEGRVCITRAEGNIEFPARFMLVAASNPCPCGYFGDKEHACTCTIPQIRTYQNRIGGPLIDRIDIHLDVLRVDPNTVITTKRDDSMSSEALLEGVLAAREFSSWRIAHEDVKSGSLAAIQSCHLERKDEEFLEKVARSNSMSGRAIVRTLSVARTIADMAQRKAVDRSDLCEALDLRLREGVGSA